MLGNMQLILLRDQKPAYIHIHEDAKRLQEDAKRLECKRSKNITNITLNKIDRYR